MKPEAARLDTTKTKPLTSLEMVENMRRWLDQAERHIKKKHFFGAYKDFKAIKQCAFIASEGLSKTTVKAAMDWGCAVSMRDSKGKHTGYAVIDFTGMTYRNPK